MFQQYSVHLSICGAKPFCAASKNVLLSYAVLPRLTTVLPGSGRTEWYLNKNLLVGKKVPFLSTQTLGKLPNPEKLHLWYPNPNGKHPHGTSLPLWDPFPPPYENKLTLPIITCHASQYLVLPIHILFPLSCICK